MYYGKLSSLTPLTTTYDIKVIYFVFIIILTNN